MKTVILLAVLCCVTVVVSAEPTYTNSTYELLLDPLGESLGDLSEFLEFLLPIDYEDYLFRFYRYIQAKGKLFRCRGIAQATVFKGTKYQKLFDDHVVHMKYVKAQLKKCLAKDTNTEAFNCAIAEGKDAIAKLANFVRKIAMMYIEVKNNKDIMGRVWDGLVKCQNKQPH